MTRRPRRKNTGTLLKSLYIWHRWLGLTAVVFLMILSATGLMLNHTERLGLDDTPVTSDALLDWYGIGLPENITSYVAGDTRITSVGSVVFCHAQVLDHVRGPLLGAVVSDGLVVLAGRNAVTLLTPACELVEQLDETLGVPQAINAIGNGPNQSVIVDTASGRYLASKDFDRWLLTRKTPGSWSRHSAPATAQLERLKAAYRGNDLPLERVVLDLHSGRILGAFGVWIMDAAAILCLLLGASGVWLWARRRLSARAHRRKLKARRRLAATQRAR